MRKIYFASVIKVFFNATKNNKGVIVIKKERRIVNKYLEGFQKSKQWTRSYYLDVWKEMYTEYRQLQKEIQEWMKVRKNVECFLVDEVKNEDREKSHKIKRQGSLMWVLPSLFS